MSTQSTASEPALTPIKFSRLVRRGVLLGLSGPQLAMTGVAAGSLILGLYVGPVVLALPVITFSMSVAFVRVGGRTLVEWGPIGLVWVWRSTGGQLVYRRRILTSNGGDPSCPAPNGTGAGGNHWSHWTRVVVGPRRPGRGAGSTAVGPGSGP